MVAFNVARSVSVVGALAGFVCGLFGTAPSARALSIELKDVAADRINRQRSWAEGALPLPGTPNIAILDDRLKEKGVSLDAPMIIRVFKMESELEIWKEKSGEFVLFATYPICHWSGSLGPKLREGDKQAPEGFYTVTRKQLHHVGRWPKSLYLNFPNILDQSLARTGAHILIHGGCTSVGCFAMTNPVMDEIHRITAAAIEGGQGHVPVHVFPFRMTDENVEAHGTPAWNPFWVNLKEGFDNFERTKRPPRINACDGKYVFSDSVAGSDTGPIEACVSTIANIKEQDQWLDGLAANAPVRTAAASQAIATDAPGDSRSLTDAIMNGDSTAEADTDRISLPSATQAAGPVAEAAVVRCRFAHKVCRDTLSLSGVQAARKVARLAAGLRRVMPPERSAETAAR